MKCPMCPWDIDDDLIRSEGARLSGIKGGALGGRSRSKAKIRASIENLKKANKARKEKV